MGAMTRPAGFHTRSGVSVGMGVSVGKGVLVGVEVSVGVGVELIVGVKVGRMTIAVLVDARNGVAVSVEVA
jgi:hypothetical protein